MLHYCDSCETYFDVSIFEADCPHNLIREERTKEPKVQLMATIPPVEMPKDDDFRSLLAAALQDAERIRAKEVATAQCVASFKQIEIALKENQGKFSVKQVEIDEEKARIKEENLALRMKIEIEGWIPWAKRLVTSALLLEPQSAREFKSYLRTCWSEEMGPNYRMPRAFWDAVGQLEVSGSTWNSLWESGREAPTLEYNSGRQEDLHYQIRRDPLKGQRRIEMQFAFEQDVATFSWDGQPLVAPSTDWGKEALVSILSANKGWSGWNHTFEGMIPGGPRLYNENETPLYNKYLAPFFCSAE